MAKAVLEVRGLCVGDGTGDALRDVSFTVGTGRVLGVRGDPASGKSLLLRCLGLDFPPSAGQVLLRGEPASSVSVERRRQLRAGPIELVHPPASASAADAPSETPRASRPADGGRGRTLSVAAMRQRVQVARALTHPADLLLLDEPFVGVEPGVRLRILELLTRLRRETGTAVVVASRDPATVDAVADEVVVLQDGTVCDHGTSRRLLDAPSHPHTRGLPLERRSA